MDTGHSETRLPDAEIRIGELDDGTLVLLWVEAEETWAVRLDELADWIRSHGERLSDAMID
jgi:hypothetical protein